MLDYETRPMKLKNNIYVNKTEVPTLAKLSSNRSIILRSSEIPLLVAFN